MADLYVSFYFIQIIVLIEYIDHEVTQPLPNVTFDFGRSFAGSIPLQRGTNLSLFYWAVETKKGSLTSAGDDEPWQIWLNGGPGSSSMIGFFFEVR